MRLISLIPSLVTFEEPIPELGAEKVAFSNLFSFNISFVVRSQAKAKLFNVNFQKNEAVRQGETSVRIAPLDMFDRQHNLVSSSEWPSSTFRLII